MGKFLAKLIGTAELWSFSSAPIRCDLHLFPNWRKTPSGALDVGWDGWGLGGCHAEQAIQSVLASAKVAISSRIAVVPTWGCQPQVVLQCWESSTTQGRS
jgi:hypothetical protein